MESNKKYKVLNLYACLGGNRAKWDDVADIEVTAVELDPFLAEMYQERFPNDNVIVTDAHDYLLRNYKKYDFVWDSPPCPSHSRVRFSQKNKDSFVPVYPDMKLWQEIILLQDLYEGCFIVENVIPYYKPFIPAQQRGKYLFWSNFKIPYDLNERKKPPIGGKTQKIVEKLNEFHEVNVYEYKGRQRKEKIARNLMDYEIGKSLFKRAVEVMKGKDDNQIGIFEQLKTIEQ